MITGRVVKVALVVMAVSGAAWTYFTQLTEVAVASGAVVPQSQVRQVAHLEGGIVANIFVRDGQMVTAGQPLLQIELAPTDLNPIELGARLDGLRIANARMAAESRDTVPNWPTEAVARQPDIAQAERQAYDSRRAQLTTSLAVLDRVAEQRRLEVQELESRRTSLRSELDLVTRRWQISNALLAAQLTTRVEHLEIERTKTQLEGQLATITVSIPRATATFNEAQARVEDARLSFRREVQQQLAQNEVDIARTQQLLTEATRVQERTMVASPIDGVIKNVKIRSLGDVVKPGEPFLEVVPLSETLVVEVRLLPADRGNVTLGQAVVVKVSSYDFVRYGTLPGRVTYIGADADTDDKGNVYFRCQVETERAYLGTEAAPLPISTGMQATVDFVTGSKSVAERLLRPIQKIRFEAFRER
jgi:adhesin transport system membrane fusion protein